VKKFLNKSSLLKSFFLGTIIFFLVSITIKAPYFIERSVNKSEKINDYKILGENLLGLNGKKNILLLLMNNAENRYGGGFIGSVGVISVEKGKIKAESVRSVYYYDRYLRSKEPYENKPDDELGPESETLRNSGQNMDWSENGKRAKLIYESKTGQKIDLVIGVTPEVLKTLLDETGPIYLEDYSKQISSKNIIEELQTEIEFGKDKVEGKDPKSILSVLSNGLILRLSKKGANELIQISEKLKDEAEKRQIIIYSSSYDLSKSLSRLRYDGSVVRTNKDTLLVSENNLSIDKSNAYIDRTLGRKFTIGDSGKAEIELTIKRKQIRDKSIPYIDPRDNYYTYLIKENSSDIRVAIPKNSIIIKTDGLKDFRKVASTSGEDIYQFNSQLIPFVESNYYISYELPYRYANFNPINIDSYIQLQNGGWPYKLINTVVAPKGWKILASNKKEVAVSSEGSLVYNKNVDRDIFLSFIYEKK